MRKVESVEKSTLTKKILKIAGRIGLCIITLVAGVAVLALLSINIIVNGGSESARQTFVSTILETGALKFLASWYLEPEEIQAIVDANTMKEFNDEVNTSLITIVAGNEAIGGKQQSEQSETMVATRSESGDRTAVVGEVDEDGDGIILYDIAGNGFFARMMVILDPSRVCIENYFNDFKTGAPLDKIVSYYGGIAGINGGIYNQTEAGGRPYGVVVCHGELQRNTPQEQKGLVLIGMTEDNFLIIEDISKLDSEALENLVHEKKIRDACCFQEESSDKNNHFVQLVINGVPREMNGGMGSGQNPRTAIGQRYDGAILLLVTDGRGKNSHMGATASDLIGIMMEYGAVNAANLDGGSSSTMVLNDEYLMESVTFRKANTSWNLPLAFVVE